jgi:hypothetical protein
MLRKADGHQALIRLTLALASAEGDDAELIVDGLIELADRTEEYLKRFDTPDSAALKCERAIQAASRNGVIEHAPEAGESAAPGLRAESPADIRTPPVAPQREADSGARVPSPGTRAAPSITRGGP